MTEIIERIAGLKERLGESDEAALWREAKNDFPIFMRAHNLRELSPEDINLLIPEDELPNEILLAENMTYHRNDPKIVTSRGEANLTHTENKLVEMLYRNSRKICFHEEIRNKIWPNFSPNAYNDTVKVYMRRIRIKADDKLVSPRRYEVFQSVWGIGYRLGNPLSEANSGSTSHTIFEEEYILNDLF